MLITPTNKKVVFIALSFLFLIILLLVSFVFQGSRGIWQPDEGYYTGTAVSMLKKGTLLIPHLGEDEIFLDKPPMIYWGIIAGLKLFGHNEFAARFFHSLCYFFTCLAVGRLAYSMFKDKMLGYLSAIVYATMIIPFFAANFITPDTILTLWTTFSLLCFWESFQSSGKRRILWQMALCASVGLGFMAKGPAVIIPCGGIFVFLILQKQLGKYFLTKWSILGLIIFISLGLSWYIIVGIKIPGSIEYFVDSQITGRLLTEKFNRNPGLVGAFIYLPVIVLGSMPWSIIWFEKFYFIKSAILKKQWWQKLPEMREKLFLLCCFFIPLVILCLASSKLGLYALPLFAPLSIAMSKYWLKKAPLITDFTILYLLKTFAHPIKLLGCWIVLLLLTKLAIAYFPTHNNMKTVWEQISKHLPKGNYEICTIDERADGLLFYGAKNVEHLTKRENPYPTFTRSETILEEIQSFIDEKETGILLAIEDDDIYESVAILKKADINCKLVHLPYQRALIFPEINDNTNLQIKNLIRE